MRLVWVATLWLAASAAAFADAQPARLLQTEDASRAVIEIGDCTASLERRRREPDLVHLRDSCPRPLADKLVSLSQLVDTLLPVPDTRSEIHTLLLGRLQPTFPELSRRLALAASRSPTIWDPDGPRPNAAVAELLTPGLRRELDATLAALSWRVTNVSVEKVLVQRADGLALGDAFEGSAQARLPFDAIVWLGLAPRSPIDLQASEP